MARTSGTEVAVGFGLETTPGTPVAATFYPMFRELSIQPVVEKATFEAARGVRNLASNSIIRRKFGQGSIGLVLDPEIAGFLFRVALGSISSALAGGESIVYNHTITVQNTNASMKTFTTIVEDGAIVTERYANCVVSSMTIETSDSFASITTEILGSFPDSSTLSETYTNQTLFAYHNMTVKFGTNLTNANAASATPLKSFNLTVNNNVSEDDAFLSGSNIPVAGGFSAGPLEVSGSYSLLFSDTTEYNKYKNHTKHAAVVTFTGAAIGVAEFERVKISLGRLILTKPPVEVNIDGLLVITQEFTVEYDTTDKEITVIVTNLKNAAAYA